MVATEIADSDEEPCKRRRVVKSVASTTTRAVRAEHVFDLTSRFGHLLNDRATSDVTFECKDGVSVFAHRALLMSSPVLRNMLYGGMKEAKQREVALPELSSNEVLATFQILYTGQAELSWELAIGVLHAANFLLLPQLEEPVVKGMRELISEILDVGLVATNLSVALRPGLGLESKHQDLIHSLVRFLEARYLRPEHVVCLSHDALLCYLEGTQLLEQEPLYSFSEYRKLRNVTLWCACQLVSDACGQDPLISHLPADEGTLNSIVGEDRGTSSFQDYEDALKAGIDVPLDVQKVFSRCRDKLAELRLIQYLKLSAIHPKLLLKLIEPLGLFPQAELLKAYRWQAISYVKDCDETKERDDSDESDESDEEADEGNETETTDSSD